MAMVLDPDAILLPADIRQEVSRWAATLRISEADVVTMALRDYLGLVTRPEPPVTPQMPMRAYVLDVLQRGGPLHVKQIRRLVPPCDPDGLCALVSRMRAAGELVRVSPGVYDVADGERPERA